MSIPILTNDEITKMKIAGQLAAEVLQVLDPYVKAGISTGFLDDLAYKHITEVQHAIPACLNYKGYPFTLCTSINHVVCHGMPDHQRILKDGLSSILMLL